MVLSISPPLDTQTAGRWRAAANVVGPILRLLEKSMEIQASVPIESDAQGRVITRDHRQVDVGRRWEPPPAVLCWHSGHRLSAAWLAWKFSSAEQLRRENGKDCPQAYDSAMVGAG
jgi:hypothetical protein